VTFEVWKEVEITFNAETVRGSYCVSGKVLTVTATAGSKSTQLGEMPAQVLAKTLLRELAAEGKGKA
jgi:hypothetical protein